MDSNTDHFTAEGLKELFHPFTWKNLSVYILLLVSTGIYGYLFYISPEVEKFGILEKSRETKVSLIFFCTLFLFLVFRSSKLVKKVDRLVFRGLLLFSAFILTLFFVLLGWRFNTYDHQKMNSYFRIFPFTASPHVKSKETLFFNNVTAVEYNAGLDGGGSIRFILKHGEVQGLELGTITNIARDIFLINLYETCSWLQDNIINEFGPIEKRKAYVEKQTGRRHFTLVHSALYIFFIWTTLLCITCLIRYTFKIKK